MADLHLSVQEKLDWFDPDHFGSDLKWVVGYCRDLALIMSSIPSHPQLILGLQHLIEAQECFVKALRAGQKADTELLAANPEVAKAIDDFLGDPDSGFQRGRPIRDNPQA